ncbi:hypothetical protein TNCV_514421 [Trichonephila clavipes]|nr:hypothetical protein TNCV_514421 [Trichonephila clavipes]
MLRLPNKRKRTYTQRIKKIVSAISTFARRGGDKSKRRRLQGEGKQAKKASTEKLAFYTGSEDHVTIFNKSSDWLKWEGKRFLSRNGQTVPHRSQRVFLQPTKTSANQIHKGVRKLRCRPRHLTMVQNYEVRRQKPSCDELSEFNRKGNDEYLVHYGQSLTHRKKSQSVVKTSGCPLGERHVVGLGSYNPLYVELLISVGRIIETPIAFFRELGRLFPKDQSCSSKFFLNSLSPLGSFRLTS